VVRTFSRAPASAASTDDGFAVSVSRKRTTLRSSACAWLAANDSSLPVMPISVCQPTVWPFGRSSSRLA
jgi:hypothetical protein